MLIPEKLLAATLAVSRAMPQAYCSQESAWSLWQSIPAEYRQCATVYTDCWEAYETVIPAKRHRAVGKDSGLTSYIERLNNTLRQR